MDHYLAIDIGASSGRHILGTYESGRISTEVIYRFDNGMTDIGGTLTWDIDTLFDHIVEGIRLCGAMGYTPKSIAIDTWGVDYVLTDEKGDPILPAVAYRDPSNERAAKELHNIIPFEELYAVTGIQFQPFNTLYQLYRDKCSGKLERARRVLMMPDYFAYRLTGVMKNEYTNATTGAIVRGEDKKIASELFERTGISRSLFADELSQPCEAVGTLLPEIQRAVGFDSKVLLCATHDTASAVAACPLETGTVYLSSGTWSLIGAEIPNALTSPEAREANFTNEGGIEGRFRFLKNIMGTWLFSQIRQCIGKSLTYDEMMMLAKSSDFVAYFDVNDRSLNAPENMINAIEELIGRGELPLPDLLNSTYHSLARAYAVAASEISRLTKTEYRSLFIVGGGSRDAYLNELASRYTQLPVMIGLSEATALGNILSQIMADHGMDLDSARRAVGASFEVVRI